MVSQFRLVSDCATAIGARSENQDGYARLIRRNGGGFFAVADGLGGHQGGRQAAQIALRAAGEFYRDQLSDPSHDPEEGALACVKAAAAAVHSGRKGAFAAMATTLVVLVAGADRAGWAWCGDSRLYRKRGDHIERLTTDHSLAMAGVEPSERPDADVRRNPVRNRLVSVIGEADPLIETGSDVLQGNDRFVLCTDGYWENISREEIAAFLVDRPDARSMAQHVLKKSHPDQDNLTLVVLGFLEESRSPIGNITF